MTFNYDKLRERVREKYESEALFAKQLNISLHALTQKLDNRLQFTHNEILKAVHVLEISGEEIYEYFFDEKFRTTELIGEAVWS